MDKRDIAVEIAEFVSVASFEWLKLGKKNFAQQEQQRAISTSDAERRAKIRTICGHMEQVAEIDARIALIEATPALHDRDKILHTLRHLRGALVQRKYEKSKA